MAVHWLAILLGRNKAGISNRGKTFLHHTVRREEENERGGAVCVTSGGTKVVYKKNIQTKFLIQLLTT